MAPMVIDLTSSPEPDDESPGKAVQSALQHFQPRTQKTNQLRPENDKRDAAPEESPGKPARTALAGFQPRKQKKARNQYSDSAQTPLWLPDDARAELQKIRPFRETPASHEEGRGDQSGHENSYERLTHQKTGQSEGLPRQRNSSGAATSSLRLERDHTSPLEERIAVPREDNGSKNILHESHTLLNTIRDLEHTSKPNGNPPSQTEVANKTAKAAKAPIEIVDLEQGDNESGYGRAGYRNAVIPKDVFGGIRPFKRRRIGDLDAPIANDVEIPTLDGLLSGNRKATEPAPVSGDSHNFGPAVNTPPVESVSTHPLRVTNGQQRPLSSLSTASGAVKSRPTSTHSGRQDLHTTFDNNDGTFRRAAQSQNLTRETSKDVAVDERRPPLRKVTEEKTDQQTSTPSNHGVPYSPAEDALLKKLKEVDKLPWDQILTHFNGRSYGSLQVRYSSKLKDRSPNQAQERRNGTAQLHQQVPMSNYREPSSADEDHVRARPQRRKRNNEVSVTAGVISWADVKNRRLMDESKTVTQDEQAGKAPDRQFNGERAYPRSLSRIIRQREIGTSARNPAPSIRSVPAELKEHILDDIGPRMCFTGTSGDVTCLAWAPDGAHFATGSIAISDERSMQYNRSCNLLLGDHRRSVLHELPEHYIPRPQLGSDSGNVNGLHAMRETQDPRLFMTVSCVQFSSDGHTLFSAGTDRKVRAYACEGKSPASCLYEIEHPAPVYLLSVSNLNVLATASHQAADGSIGVYHKEKQILSLSPSRRDTQTERAIYPSALKWGIASRHSNLLLAGFSIDSTDEERDTAGETCLWDVRAEARIEINTITRNVFDIAWNPCPSSTSTVFAVASTPGQNKVNKGMRSVVQCFAPSQNKATCVLELECPAFDINDVIYCPHDDNLIATGATDGKVYVWDQRFANVKQAPLLVLAHDESLNVLDHDRQREIADTGVRFLSWGATSSRLYSGSSDGVVKVWNPYRSSDEAQVKDVATFTSAVMSGSFSPDYRELLIGEDQGRINLLSVGYGDRSVRAMEPFSLHPAPYEETRPSTPVGHRAARDLVRSKEIELRPMGALPMRQAVQGPAYHGPYLAPTAEEIGEAGMAYQLALDEQNDAHSQAALNESQSDGASQTLRNVDRKVETAQSRLLNLQRRLNDSTTLEPMAGATQQAFRRAVRDRMKDEALLSRALENCRLDCNYLPANVDEDAEVPVSHRSEARIPTALRRPLNIDISTNTPEDLAEAGFTLKCAICLGPASKPKAGVPLCPKCRCISLGLTSSCEICSSPIQPPTDALGSRLCERCNFACFRCRGPTIIARNALRIECDSCGLGWIAGILGYELENPSQAPRGAKAERLKAVSAAEDTMVHKESLGNSEIEHYASMWQTISMK